jgi:predicted ATPase
LIESISIDGFKSLRKISIEIKPLTVLIGLNSSGKSSILQLLQTLKQTMISGTRSDLLLTGDLVNLGSFDDVISKGKKEIEFSVGGRRAQFLDPPFHRVTEYGYMFAIDSKGVSYNQAEIKSGQFRVADAYERKRGSKRIDIPFHKGSLFIDTSNYVGRPLQFTGHSGNVESFNIDALHAFLDVIVRDFRDFYLVPATRGISSPTYPLDIRSSGDLVDVQNLHRQAIKFSSTVVYESPAMERKINNWISRITGVTIRARTVPDKQASIEAHRKYDINLINEGFGTNQLVHLFAQIAKSPVPSIVGIEEPEVHLHPKAQSELAKVLSEIAKEENKKLILTTHSEHILYRLLIEIGKGNLESKDLAIYHFALSKEGITKVQRLIPDEKGRLDRGIPDFLEKDLEEFKDFLEALKVKQD